MRRWLIILFATICLTVQAEEADSVTTVADSVVTDDLITNHYNLFPEKRPGFFTRFFAAFDNYDTTWVEPNHYHWAFMLQNTNTFERYNLRSTSAHQKLSFSPSPGVKIGPYIGWKIIFLGYTVDLTHLGNKASKKTEFELCLYTSRFGADIIYRRTGDDYRLKTDKEYVDAGGAVRAHVTGVNTYYIFNHRHFSYPAAMSQSTVQRRSAGSFMAGASFTHHNLSFDYQSLSAANGIELDHNLCFDRLKYNDYSLSFGYGYNWVFRRNWLLCVSAMPAIGYKHLSAGYALPTDIEEDNRPFATRIGNAFNTDFTARASIVWNNTKYYGGVALVMHSYRYRHDHLVISNTWGNIAVYWGLNFIKKKGH